MSAEIVQTLIRRCFGPQSGEMQVSGVSTTALAERYGTPLYVYDRNGIQRQFDALRSALPPEFKIYYSMKANPNMAILADFIARGCGLEVASAGEFIQARAAGCAADEILFAGPGKTDSELELTLKAGIGEIHIESFNEARRIVRICRQSDVRARVAVRINPSADVQGGAMRMGGKPAPFGVDEEEIGPLVDYLVSDFCFDFTGIHMFAGTQVLDATVLINQYKKGLQIARDLFSKIGRPLRTVDFGGGLGIPYFAGEHELDLKSLHAGLGNLMAEVRREPSFAGTRFVVEPGRFLVGEAGIYVARVIDIKESRGRKFLVMDGGMNHHLAASGNLGQTIKRNYPIALLQRLDQPATETVDIVGPLCTPLDTLGRSVTLPKAEVGDLVGIFQSGAYARTASPLGFLSHCTPPEVCVYDGEHCLIRSRGELDDFMRDVRLPSFDSVDL
jgi:diaminopimelate decarboxylase